MSSYKRKRSRKKWNIDTLQKRIQDALSAIEPVFLGEEGKDYDRDDIQLKCKAAHAYSQLASKARKLIELEEIEERLQKLEEIHNQK